ncbi:membrane-bound lytic murein transglycosylase A [Polaromonas sp. YR568]|uniref:murein transglycosylase A n=1 Tax=Polaromonas sp. YR568 TaxID=1855301 RepID=UPI0008E1E959|nr:MltA domain-containing protein [Polaromonas sp. YR568]SFV01589.1 membrane-bound lytic murein transglycosylase A [Polaromonas sp. YR568]
MNTSSSNAPRASSKSKAMIFPWIPSIRAGRSMRLTRLVPIIATVLLASCASPPLPPSPTSSGAPPAAGSRPGDSGPLPASIVQGKSRWVPVRWAELPGFEEDQLFEAWNAWLKSCERPGPVFAPLCAEVRRLSIASAEEQRNWMVSRLQPYRVESPQGAADGLLTSYFEPVLKASRQPGAGFDVPLYRTPASLGSRKPWFSRQEIDTLPEARAALKGREIAWLADPVEAMSLHIQGSGRLSITEPDGAQRMIRVAYAGSNEQPFRSVTQWLLDQGEGRMTTPWVESTKAWAARNPPQRVQQMLWSNPRYTFFQEQPLSELDAAFGPKGAQGVALTPGRSIAVDPGSIPYGTPVWLASRGGAGSLQKLVLAQDTGSAITGAVRADYFAGTGPEAGQFAARMNQPLRLWVLWPR